MGGEESAPAKQQQQVQKQQQLQQMQGFGQNQKPNESIQQEYDGIPTIHPLVLRSLMKEQFPNDIRIDCANLPVAHQITQLYFRNINLAISQNEERIAVQTKKQLEEYIGLAGILQKRQNELDGRLAKMLSYFRQFNDDVNATTEQLKATIQKADAIAAQIDPTLSFKDFN